MTREEYLIRLKELLQEYVKDYKPLFKSGQLVGLKEYAETPLENIDLYVIKRETGINNDGYYEYEISDYYDRTITSYVSEHELIDRNDINI